MRLKITNMYNKLLDSAKRMLKKFGLSRQKIRNLLNLVNIFTV